MRSKLLKVSLSAHGIKGPTIVPMTSPERHSTVTIQTPNMRETSISRVLTGVAWTISTDLCVSSRITPVTTKTAAKKIENRLNADMVSAIGIAPLTLTRSPPATPIAKSS